jgi:hypothetical protein
VNFAVDACLEVDKAAASQEWRENDQLQSADRALETVGLGAADHVALLQRTYFQLSIERQYN